ncbi:GIY-YIG nuclease family protein [Pseudoneobacillus sp. C159]
MAARGKSINLYLMDGEASGRIKCSLANWTGVAYKIPRTELEKCKERNDLKQSGVYFLFGISDTTGENMVYIGQAGARKNGEGILNRLQEHKRNIDKITGQRRLCSPPQIIPLAQRKLATVKIAFVILQLTPKDML